MSQKVVSLFQHDQVRQGDWNPQQIELFGRKDNGVHSWVLVYPHEFNQKNFLSLVVRNRFDLILDLRPIAVFEKPQYNHKALMSNLYTSHVSYIDIAHLAHSKDSDFSIFFHEFEQKILESHGESSPPFYTLCLSDDSQAAKNIARLFRSAMRRFGSRIVELHPRAILS